MKLADLLERTGLDVLDHLERQITVPVIDGLQAQGDLLVAPLALLPEVSAESWARWQEVPSDGVELVRGIAGTNPHTLVADPGTCHLATGVFDPQRLAIALVENTAPVHLIHPEHGATGIAPGRWLIRRQREYAATGHLTRLVAD